ncbi:MAG: ATP-binding cassette subfamily C protein LapB, partial [Flavobacteriales bacterium]
MDADSSVHNKNSTSEYANHSDEPDTIKPFDFLLSSLLCLAKQKKLHASKAALLSGLPLTQECLTPDLVDRAVARIGLKAKVIERILGDISSIVLPCVILLKGNRSAVLLSLDKTLDECVVIEGSNETSQKKSISELTQDYTGHAILFSEVPHFDNHLNSPRPERSFAWLRNVLSYSAKIYRDVLLASLFINIFVVANPLFVMNVYDRVVPNNAFETLWALAVGILVLYGFDFALRSLRSYFVELAGKKTDVLLSTQIFERVLGARYAVHPKSVGAFVSQLKDFDAVRSFISSSTILAFIDFPFVIIFLLVIAYIGGPMVW